MLAQAAASTVTNGSSPAFTLAEPRAVRVPPAGSEPASAADEQQGSGTGPAAVAAAEPEEPFTLVKKVALAGGMLDLVSLGAGRMLRVWTPPGAPTMPRACMPPTWWVDGTIVGTERGDARALLLQATAGRRHRATHIPCCCSTMARTCLMTACPSAAAPGVRERRRHG